MSTASIAAQVGIVAFANQNREISNGEVVVQVDLHPGTGLIVIHSTPVLSLEDITIVPREPAITAGVQIGTGSITTSIIKMLKEMG